MGKVIEDKGWAEFLQQIGPIGDFRPCAFYNEGLRDVKVITKDCSYVARRMNAWIDTFWENYRPWYAPWGKCVGFTVFCPDALELYGQVSVEDILNQVAVKASENPFGKDEKLLRRLAKA